MWQSDQFLMTRGSLTDNAKGPALIADSTGSILVNLPTEELQLQHATMLRLELTGPPPLRAFIHWLPEAGGTQVMEVEIAPPTAGDTTYDLAATPKWNGAATSLWLQLVTTPNGSIGLRQISLEPASLVGKVSASLHNWRTDPNWRHSDINFLSGTTLLRQPPYPTPFFAGLLGFAVGALWVFWRLRKHRSPFNWKIAGFLVIFIWILSDISLQVRLWNQVKTTWVTYAGKSPEEKLLASRNSLFSTAMAEVREHISAENARVFLSSSGDYQGMVSAYYLSPLNIYWHRKGPDLPSRDSFRPGDYILLVAPSGVKYDQQAGLIRRPGEDDLKVELEYHNQISILLRVI